ncbi:MAG: penicillin-binding protein 2 [Bauldia sp.]|nr:MAG: penicillin-binding protein 2 [Bauldia sp.]
MPSLYADPRSVIDRDEVVERLATVLPGLDTRALLNQLANRDRRFIWIRRGLTPELQRDIHDLGLAGLGFRREPHRFYPRGLLGQFLGQVSFENRGLSGLERALDELAQDSPDAPRQPMRISVDLSVQHAVKDELDRALQRYRAKAASAIVLDVDSGEIVAAVSLPEADPRAPISDQTPIDRNTGGVYELGSIAKLITLAMAFEESAATPETTYDAREPLEIAGKRISDLHPQKRILTAREVFLFSSNIGASRMGLEIGPERQKAFLARLGLIEPIRTEAGPIAAPLLPKRWGPVETATISFGHGIALSPLQFTAAAATLVNGGKRVKPTFLAVNRKSLVHQESVVSPETSARIRDLLRLNVISPRGTGRLAEVDVYRVGGKTGTAELPENGRYASRKVISSFLAAFPIEAPRYVTLVSLYEPEPTFETKGQITAGVNAVPLTRKIIERVGPLLGLVPPHPDGIVVERTSEL